MPGYETENHIFSAHNNDDNSASLAQNSPVETFCQQYRFQHLSNEQKTAIQRVDGKTVLFAVPGSGKTTVLIARTGYMVCAQHIPPQDIISLTFTKAAAKEMKQRFQNKFHSISIPDFRTINSFCASIALPYLKQSGFRYPEKVFSDNNDDDEYNANSVYSILFKKIELYVPKNEFEVTKTAVSNLITKIKNGSLDANLYSGVTINLRGSEFDSYEVYNQYQSILSELDTMDYDDQIKYTLAGLEQYPAVLHKLWNRFRYWNVDEAQDTSPLQFKLIELLSSGNGNLFIVGDDDQSIYGFRGSNPELLRNFSRKPDVQTIEIGINYRSDFSLVKTAKAFIETNANRKRKNLRPNSTKIGSIQIPDTFNSEIEQYEYITRAAKQSLQNNETLAVLYRLNQSALPLLYYFKLNAIPFEIKGIRGLFSGFTVKSLYQILRFVANSRSVPFFLQCKNDLKISINPLIEKLLLRASLNSNLSALSMLEKIYVTHNKHGVFDAQLKQLQIVAKLLDEIRAGRPSNAIIRLTRELVSVPETNITDRLDIYTLLSASDLFQTIPEFIHVTEELMSQQPSSSAPIVLSTIHSAKGREFDHVILIDCFHEIMSSEQTTKDILAGKKTAATINFDPEEEKRLFYVAVTRAKHSLEILTVEKYHRNHERISQLVSEFSWLYDSIYPDTEDILRQERTRIKSTAYPLKPTAHPEAKPASDSFIFKSEKLDIYFSSSGGRSFNTPVSDLPKALTKSIHDYFQVQKINDIPRNKLALLKEKGKLFGNQSRTDYSDSTDAYLLSYLPVNFFKLWKPLKYLLDNGLLSSSYKVLDVGTGPGTSTFSFLWFYRALALSNPEIHFNINVTAIDREKNFARPFNALKKSVVEKSLPNYNPSARFLCEEFNTYACINEKFDIIMESNMLNNEEGANLQEHETYIQFLFQHLRPGGIAILIEPGKAKNRDDLKRIVHIAESSYFTEVYAPEISSVNISGITLYQEALEAKIRYGRKAEHWFSYTILSKGGQNDSQC